VRTVSVPRIGGGTPIRYVFIDDAATLAWCANLASLELHSFLHSAPPIESPTPLVFDLDPGRGADIRHCMELARLLKRVLHEMKLQALAKGFRLQGDPGLCSAEHGGHNDATRSFARDVTAAIERKHPTLVVCEMSKPARAGRS